HRHAAGADRGLPGQRRPERRHHDGRAAGAAGVHSHLRVKRWVGALALAAAAALAARAAWSAGAGSHIHVAIRARRAPYPTALMRQRADEAARAGRPYHVDTRWIPYDQVSPLLRRAVLIAEDDAFYQHGGLDWNELRESTRRDLEAHRVVRGGS